MGPYLSLGTVTEVRLCQFLWVGWLPALREHLAGEGSLGPQAGAVPVTATAQDFPWLLKKNSDFIQLYYVTDNLQSSSTVGLMVVTDNLQSSSTVGLMVTPLLI